MSRTFSMNSGSRDSLKVSVRWGCSPKARQIRLIVCDRPVAFAIPLRLQWVSPGGAVSRVRINTRFMSASAIARGAPGRGSTYRPSSRSRTKAAPPLPEGLRPRVQSRATPVLASPSPHSKMIRARRARCGRVRARVASDSKLSRSAAVNTSGAFGRPVGISFPLVEQTHTGLLLPFVPPSSGTGHY